MDKIKALLFSNGIIRIDVIIILLILFIIAGFLIIKIKFLNKPFYKFVLIGGFNTFNYYVLFIFLLKMQPYMISHLIAFIYSALVSYFLTTYYTFNKKPTLKTFIAFPLTFLPNLILSSLGTIFFVELGLFTKDIASLIMMIIIIPITFIINKLIFITKDYKNAQ